MVILKVKLEGGRHGEFKSWCARHGTSMQRQIDWWITNECCGEVGKVPNLSRRERSSVASALEGDSIAQPAALNETKEVEQDTVAPVETKHAVDSEPMCMMCRVKPAVKGQALCKECSK